MVTILQQVIWHTQIYHRRIVRRYQIHPSADTGVFFTIVIAIITIVFFSSTVFSIVNVSAFTCISHDRCLRRKNLIYNRNSKYLAGSRQPTADSRIKLTSIRIQIHSLFEILEAIVDVRVVPVKQKILRFLRFLRALNRLAKVDLY